MEKVLIFGHEGQDGTLLRQSLAIQGKEVIGVGPNAVIFFDSHGQPAEKLARPNSLNHLVREHVPSEVYYLAAKHTSAEGDLATVSSVESYLEYFETNALSYLRVLETLSSFSPESRIFYAGSSHIFGPGEVRSLTEETAFNPQSFYGMSKAQGIWFSQKFRIEHDLHVSTGILFNHESHLRGPNFFSSRLIHEAIKVKRGLATRVEVGDLTARADWGHARDFVEAFQKILKLPAAGDFVIATGETRSVKDFVEVVFSFLELDWKKHVVVGGLTSIQRNTIERANPGKIFQETSWRPTNNFEDFVRALVGEHLNHCQIPD